MDLNARQRFWRYVRIEDGKPCWEWTGVRTKRGEGHGLFVYTIDKVNTQILAHRFAYLTIAGEIPDGMQLDHLCRNRACVNPAHLEPVTQRENVLRGIGPTAINARKTHCHRGHEFTSENTYRSKKGRECRSCLAIRQAAYHQRKREKASN